MSKVKIEELEKRYKEWALGLLKARFNLKPEAFDEHHKNNYSYESCVEILWTFVKSSFERNLYMEDKVDKLRDKITNMKGKCSKKIIKLFRDKLRGEEHRLYGADSLKKFCAISYDDLDRFANEVYWEVNKNDQHS